jgi:Domain of unknown function (DUF4160)
MHVHVASGDGEAKFWMQPAIELAVNKGLSSRELTTIAKILERRRDEIESAWRSHFDG